MSRRLPRSQSPMPLRVIDAPLRWEILTRIAFGIAVSIVIARMTSLEMLRDPWDASPGATAVPRAPGAATSLVLDLLSIVPALLVLARRSLDSTFRLTPRWSHVAMLLLGIWAMISTFWADDKFAAAVSGAQLFSGVCLLWAVSQIVRDWGHFRVVVAICFGLLLVLLAQSVIYRTVDVPANIRYWAEHHDEILQQHGWKPNSFHALQFEHKITSGELVGFFTSANTFAAVGVVLLIISMGIGVQKLKDSGELAWLAISGGALLAAIWIIIEARSKAAGATPLIGVILFLGAIYLRTFLVRFSKSSFWLCAAGVCVVLASIVVSANHKDGLFPGHFSNSLDFRWKYWVASTRVFAEHPLIGTGWGNFGLYYLAHRLPEAAEEIKDPHNFLVRFFVELGIVGGVLLLAWLLRLAWEITRPGTPDDEIGEKRSAPPGIGAVILIASLGMLVSILVNIDFSLMDADVVLELMRRMLYLLALILGAVGAAMLSPHDHDIDARPAPWLYYCVLIAMALLLIHNLIDFSLFEAGPMFLFMLLAGAALGMARSKQATTSHRGVAIGALLIATAAWLIGAGLAGQVIAAEQLAYDASEEIRTADKNNPEQMRGNFSRAAADYLSALSHVPINADYALQAAKSLMASGQFAQSVAMTDEAIRLNPRSVDALLLRTDLEMRRKSPGASRVQSDFDRVLELNPNEVSLRIQYAEALVRLGLGDLARQQYELALKYNSVLPEGEPKRLGPEQVTDLQDQIVKLGGGPPGH